MQLKLGFEVDANVTQAKGEAVIDLGLSASNAQAVVTVTNITIDSSNVVLDVVSQILSQPLREILAQQLSQALNQAIADLPQHVSGLKKVQIIDVRD
jgi:uncharacterized SAM-dependent methyltransferase